MDRFANLTEDEQRQYMARALGCDPDAPAGWPNKIIDDLIAVRLNDGSKAYYEKLGYLLSLT